MAIRPCSENQSTRSQTADEDRQHRCRGGGGCPEDQPEFSRPDDLVHEGAQTRAEKKRRNLSGAVTTWDHRFPPGDASETTKRELPQRERISCLDEEGRLSR